VGTFLTLALTALRTRAMVDRCPAGCGAGRPTTVSRGAEGEAEGFGEGLQGLMGAGRTRRPALDGACCASEELVTEGGGGAREEERQGFIAEVTGRFSV